MAKGYARADTFVFVEVLQNGVPMASTRWKATRRGHMYLTAGPGGELVLPHYPFPDNRLDFMHVARGKATLEIDHRWEGFCTSKGELIQIDRKSHGRHVLELGKGDYASVARDDLRIMVRIGPEKARKGPQARRGTDPKYVASFVGNFISTTEEWRSLAVAALAALVVIGGMASGLARRPNHKPTGLEDLGPEYLLPFVGKAHIETGPEALQDNLNRRNQLRSVIDHYSSFAGMLLGREDFDERQVFPTTRRDYVRLYDDAAESINVAEEKQRTLDDSQLAKKGTAVLTVPTVVGESASGSMLRLIDKIQIKQTAHAMNFEAKRAIVKEFPKDPNYDYEEYKNLTALNDKRAEVLSQIKPWARATDEELMYGDAQKLAARAEARQRRILRGVSPSEYLDPEQSSPIGLPSGARFASFVGGVDFMMSDDKLYQIQASEWGRRPGPTSQAIVVREPLVGEIDPSLVERHIQQNRFQLQLCYELALRRDEAARGTMEWKWRIDTRGLISDLALVSSSIQDQRMVKCIRQKIATWRFPRPRRGSVEISYPFEFAPTKG